MTEGLKRFEYGLRRKVGDDADRALVTGADEVPQEFQKLVEEIPTARCRRGEASSDEARLAVSRLTANDGCVAGPGSAAWPPRIAIAVLLRRDDGVRPGRWFRGFGGG